ncbi:MAG: putative metal-binding motif-containing protein [Myxococcota bacterium]
MLALFWLGCAGSDPSDPGKDRTDTDTDTDTDPPDPTAPEACDGQDADADGLVDCADPDCVDRCDLDGDGFDPEALGGTDCDDDDPAVNPDAIEVCDGIDDDCDGAVDDDDSDVDATSWYVDSDGDGFGDPLHGRKQCAAVPGAVTDGSDCVDGRAEVNPGAVEVCFTPDDDCDQLIDDDDPSVDLGSAPVWFADLDVDGHGDPASTLSACERPPGYVGRDDDCDDADPAVFLAVAWVDDADGDGVGSGTPTAPACHPPSVGQVPASAGVDCDDDDPTVHPGAEDVCDDGVDQDCDGRDCNPCVEVRVGVLPSAQGAGDVYAPWEALALDSSAFGDCPVVAEDVPVGFTLADIEALDPDLLFTSDPSGPLTAYSPAEQQAIRDYVEAGHGFVTTYLVDYGGYDYSGLMDLAGVDAAAFDANYVACDTLVSVLDPAHPLAYALPGSFDLQVHPYAQLAVMPWEDALLPGATLVLASADGLNVEIAYEDGESRGVMASAMLDFSVTSDAQFQALYNVVYWAGGYDR